VLNPGEGGRQSVSVCRSPSVLLVVFALAIVLSERDAVASALPKTVYLNFSDGSEAVRRGGADDASTNVSYMCDASPFLAWDGAMDCGDRASCRAQVADLVQEDWTEFNVEFTVQRPAGEFTMVMIGPPSGTCAFGLRGISRVDCGNQSNQDVVFAFECSGSTSRCSSVISHELGHAFGLSHTTEPMDLMYSSMLDGVSQTFLDRWLSVSDEGCGESSQNSHAQLLDTLGAWPSVRPHSRDWMPESGGCRLAIGSERSAALWAPLAALALLRRRSRRGTAATAAPSGRWARGRARRFRCDKSRLPGSE
jgi:hypothetical protein